MNGDGEGRLDGHRDDGEPVKIIYKESRILESDARNRFTEAEREREYEREATAKRTGNDRRSTSWFFTLVNSLTRPESASSPLAPSVSF